VKGPFFASLHRPHPTLTSVGPVFEPIRAAFLPRLLALAAAPADETAAGAVQPLSTRCLAAEAATCLCEKAPLAPAPVAHGAAAAGASTDDAEAATRARVLRAQLVALIEESTEQLGRAIVEAGDFMLQGTT
jgi:hypothetical protein